MSNEATACCACLRVAYSPVHKDGLSSERWVCETCGGEFVRRRPSPWVPVSERLPEHEECVLIGHPEGFVGEARFHKLSDNRIDWLFEPSPVRGEPWSGRRAVPAPTVWMPLPAPPNRRTE